MSKTRPSLIARLSAIPARPPSLLALWLIGAGLLMVLYWAIFYTFWPNTSPQAAAFMAFSSVGPLAVLADPTTAEHAAIGGTGNHGLRTRSRRPGQGRRNRRRDRIA